MRVRRLEEDAKDIKAVLGDLRVAIAKLPTTGNLWTMVASVLGIAIAMIGIVAALTGPFARTETVREVPAAAAPAPPQIIYIQPPSVAPAPSPPAPQAPPAE